MSKVEVIVVHESVAASYRKDFGSVAAFVAAVGIGVLLNSQPLQWVGAIIWIVVTLSAAYRSADNGRMTIDMARKRLDEIEASK